MQKFLEKNTGSIILGAGLLGIGYIMYRYSKGTFSEVLGIKGAEQQEKVIDSIFTQLKNEAGVKSQDTIGNRQKAEALYKAMNHAGTDETSVYTILKSITGPNQMKAVYLAYRIRTLYVFGIPFNEGDLFYHLLMELGRTEYDKNIATPFASWVGVKY